MSSAKGQSILEKWLQDMPNSNQRSVKRERRDCDDLLASKTSSSSNLFLNQFLPSVSALPSLPSSASSSSATSSSLGPSNNGLRAQDLSKLPKKVPDSVQDLNNCIDAKSIKGIFGWSTVNDIPLPVILREDQKLVPVRVVELKVIGKYSESLPWTVFSCINVRSYYITENEAKLLNEINGFHCNYLYGYEQFTSKDVVVCLSDVVALYKFLEQSEQIFNQGLSKADVDGLGFVNVSGYVILPYISKKTVCNTKTKASTASPPPVAATTPPPTPTSSSNNPTSNNNIPGTENESSMEDGNDLPTSESKADSEDSSSQMVQKYVPESLITKFFLLVKEDKIEMSEWDSSYLKMLYIYAGIDNCQIPPNDKLCLLSDLKWDSSLCPLQIEECDPRGGQNYHPPKNYLTSPYTHRGTERVAMDLNSHLSHHLHLHSHMNPHPHSHPHTHSHSQPVLQSHHQTRSVFSMQNSSKQNTSHHNNHNNSHHHQSFNTSNCINHNQSWPLSPANRKISRL